jgi:hypothetical protein
VNDFLASSEADTQKRRSTRIVQAIPITVTGVDALGQPFKERTTTVMVNCHGCKYQSKHYVPKNSVVTLDIPRVEPGGQPRAVVGRVIWVQRPRTVRELFQIGIEFDIPGNVWGIAFPPSDWFAHPDELPAAPPATQEPATGSVAQERAPEASSATVPTANELQTDAGPVAAAPAAGAAASDISPASPDASKIHVVPPAAPAPDSQLAVSRQMAKVVADAKENLDKTLRRGALAAINEEMTVVRQQMDAQLHDAVERAIKLSMERVSESAAKKIVQHAAERTIAIVEDARRTVQSDAVNLDAKVRQAVQEAVAGAAEHAAQEAARRANELNLAQAVEAAVEKAIQQKEASTPSLEILASPEVAQKHLDQWKNDLEQTAQGVRSRTIEQAQEDAAAAAVRLKQEMDVAVSATAQSLQGKLTEAAQVAFSQTEQEIAARNATVRSSLDEAIADARHTIESLGAGLAQQRAQTEETKSQLQDVAKTTVEQTRAQMDSIAAAHSAEIARKADEAIAQRAQQIEPILRSSTENALRHFSEELDQKLDPKLGEVENVVSELSKLGQHVAETQADIRARLQQAFDQAAQVENTIRGQVKEVSEQAVRESLASMREETAKYPVEFEEACRATLAKVEDELDQKRQETQHQSYEALLKTAEWYQKKAQTAMQASLEKSVEQSAAALRDRAAETSSMVASELDHYRRTYVEHSRAEIEESAKEVLDRERSQLGETAEIAAATFADRVQHVTADSLTRFEHASREALEKARSDMEFNREGSLAEFQKIIDERVMEGVENARTHLQSQLMPLMEAWEARREAQQREWFEQLKTASDQTIEQYKGRLENASNSWLLASATTLGQNSQAILDTLAQAAEKRLRETCAEVLAGMGDTLKERLLGISTHFGPDDEERRNKKRRQSDT